MEVDESDVDSNAGDDAMDTPDGQSKDIFQKDMWQMRLFPYADEMRKNADQHFSYVSFCHHGMAITIKSIF